MRHFVASATSAGPGRYTVGRHVRIKEGKRDGLPVARRTTFRGLPIDVELDIGMKASGKDSGGIPWEVVYKHPYGEITGTRGRDGDPVDVYIGPIDSELVYVVHQVHENGAYDEDKVFLGFDSAIAATQCYFEHGPRWGFGSLVTLTFDQFLNWYLAASQEGVESVSLIISPEAQF